MRDISTGMPPPYRPSGERAEVLLARLFVARLGVVIDPELLGEFVRGNWSALSALAHAIHERSE